MEYEIWQVWTTAEIKTTSFHEEAGAGFCRKVCSTPSNPTHKLMLLAIMLVYSADMNPRFHIHCNLVSFTEIIFFICNCVSRGQRVQTEIHLLCLCFLIFEPPHSNTSLQFLKCCLYSWKPSIMSSLLFICLSSINPTFLLFSPFPSPAFHT